VPYEHSACRRVCVCVCVRVPVAPYERSCASRQPYEPSPGSADDDGTYETAASSFDEEYSEEEYSDSEWSSEKSGRLRHSTPCNSEPLP